MRNPGKAFLELVLQQDRARTRNRWPCLLPEEGGLVPYLREGWGLMPRSGRRGGLGGLPTPVVRPGAWIVRSTSLCPRHLHNASLLVAFCTFLFRGITPTVHARSFCSSLTVCFPLLQKELVQHWCKHLGKGPQVPAYLTWKEKSRDFHR